MSLEEQMAKLTAAVEKQNSLLEKMIAGASSKPASAPAATKPADKPATKPAENKPAATKPAAATTKKKAETTAEHVAERVKDYLKGGDEDERAARKAHVKAIIDYYGADRFTTIDPASFDEALGFLDRFAAGEDPFAEDGDAGEEGQDDDDGVV